MIRHGKFFYAAVTAAVYVCAAVSLLSAADVYWDGGGSDDSWMTPQNWLGDQVPADGDRVFLDGTGETILVEAADSVTPRKIIGPCESSSGIVTMSVAGELLNNSYWYMGRQIGGTGILNVDGGSITTRDLIVAGGNGYTGIVNINSGRLTINGTAAGTGAEFGSDPTSGPTTGAATINVNNGILHISRLNPMGTNALIDISLGQLILPGDQRPLINSYISSNQIIGYGGGGQVAVDFDNLNPGETTVYAGTTIQGALAAAPAGSTIYIAAGTYDEGAFDIDKPVTLKAADGPENTIITVTGNGLCIVADDVTVEGFTIRNQTTSLTYLTRIGRSTTDTPVAVANVRLQECIFDAGNLTDGVTIYHNADNIDILSCTVHDCVNGIVVYDNAANISIIGNDLYQNTYALRTLGSTDHVKLLSNGIYWNTIYGVWNSAALTLNAKNNYWGHETGPYHPTINPTGQANAVSDLVDVHPFLIGCANDRWHLCPAGDLNKDCATDLADLAILVGSWLRCHGPECP